ncbi:MAG: hypothetical protein HY000_02510, partial [Planctomycetes bacterium]|nr:hypothetical protein [Planctomycetota bacterium]
IDQVERKAVTSVEDLQATLSKVDLSEGILVRVRRVSSGQPQTKVILVTP